MCLFCPDISFHDVIKVPVLVKGPSPVYLAYNPEVTGKRGIEDFP
jgi:hypothetical protein